MERDRAAGGAWVPDSECVARAGRVATGEERIRCRRDERKAVGAKCALSVATSASASARENVDDADEADIVAPGQRHGVGGEPVRGARVVPGRANADRREWPIRLAEDSVLRSKGCGEVSVGASRGARERDERREPACAYRWRARLAQREEIGEDEDEVHATLRCVAGRDARVASGTRRV